MSDRLPKIQKARARGGVIALTPDLPLKPIGFKRIDGMRFFETMDGRIVVAPEPPTDHWARLRRLAGMTENGSPRTAVSDLLDVVSTIEGLIAKDPQHSKMVRQGAHLLGAAIRAHFNGAVS